MPVGDGTYWLSDGYSQNRGGVPWYQAEVPRRLHRCRAQTRSWVDGYFVERCPCGGLRRDGSRWVDRNDRRVREHGPCSNCERCTWNPGSDCGHDSHPHCAVCLHCLYRHTDQAGMPLLRC